VFYTKEDAAAAVEKLDGLKMGEAGRERRIKVGLWGAVWGQGMGWGVVLD
jgi:hypothetical protein